MQSAPPVPTPSPAQLPVGGCREQERIQKSEQARRETERILWEQQQEVDRKKAEMQRRDVEREKVRLPGAVPEDEDCWLSGFMHLLRDEWRAAAMFSAHRWATWSISPRPAQCVSGKEGCQGHEAWTGWPVS